MLYTKGHTRKFILTHLKQSYALYVLHTSHANTLNIDMATIIAGTNRDAR